MKKKTLIPEGQRTRPGLDYTPQRPASPELSYGVATREKAGRRQTAHMIVARRLENFGAGVEPFSAAPTCSRWDALLPQHAPDHCSTPIGLCNHFEAQSLSHQTDLVGVLTLRFPHHEARHRLWENTRAFLKAHVVDARQLAVVMALHVPAIAARPHLPHVHALILLRRLNGPDFSVFDEQLKSSNAKQLLLDEWSRWRTCEGQHGELA